MIFVDNAFLFGPNGKLGPTWVKTLHELSFHIYSFGLEEKLADRNVSNFEYSQLDITDVEEDEIKKLFEEFAPRVVVINSGFDSRPGTGESK
ncbi:MAG: hypothetical protein ACKPKO_47185, partial [Candidatus Fonsibacter sp.]